MVHLDNIISSREKFELSLPRFATSISSREHSVERQRPRSRSSPRPRPRSRSPSVTYDPAKCCFCDSSSHSSRRCDQTMRVSMRRKIVNWQRLCFKCFGPHRRDNCDYPPCRNCGGSHHHLICIPHHTHSFHSGRSSSSSSESQDAGATHSCCRDSLPSVSPARDNRRSRDHSRGRSHHSRKRSVHRSPSWTRSKSPSSRLSFKLPVRAPDHGSSSLECRRRHQSGSPHAGTSSSAQRSAGTNEYTD
ncbi:hypothetical protein Y032_0835g2597 [Ancylostoma ceylanicum]|uniref:Uncharacterized protein n=1 Tax=Ancylostoma ceylanicum TaxID=53326 RepID=A0A016WDE4_9BILA|nr:hypothetical protein Y032_0835g2597 [Ancylostoma ceylanicum]